MSPNPNPIASAPQNSACSQRQIVTAKASPAFRAYQKVLAERIRLIEERKGPPQKGQDILLSVITDGRHAAIDTRFVLGCDTEADPHAGNEPGNKLNALIANVHRIWLETAGNRGVVQNLPFLGHTGVRRPPACEGRISTGRVSCVGGGRPLRGQARWG